VDKFAGVCGVGTVVVIAQYLPSPRRKTLRVIISISAHKSVTIWPLERYNLVN
jgi:hypothetical protein